MKEHRKVDNSGSKNESTTKPGQQQGQAHHHQEDQESRKPAPPAAAKQGGRSTPMIFTSTWPIFKFKGRTSDKKTIRNSRNGKLKKGQKSKSGDEDADFVQEIEGTLDHDDDEQEGDQVTLSENEVERNGHSLRPAENAISDDKTKIKLGQEPIEVSTVKYVVQDQVMRVCSQALNSVNPLNSCCLSTKGGYESDDRQSCEEYGTAIDTNAARKHSEKGNVNADIQENGCIQDIDSSIENLSQGVNKLLSGSKSKDTNDLNFKNVNLGCNSNQIFVDESNTMNDDRTTHRSEPATLDVTSCETMNQIEFQSDLSPRNSCPPRIMSGDLIDQLQLLSDGNICTLDNNTKQSTSSCKDSPDNPHSALSSRSISPSHLPDGFKTIDTDSNDHNFVEVSLFGSSPPKCNDEEEESAYDQQGAKPKKKGIGSFLTRNLFPRLSGGKSKKLTAPDANHKEEWSPFGRIQVKDMPDNHQKGYTHPPTGSTSWKNRQSSLGVASSTTALIFENRPGNLPAKNPEEEQRHRHMYEQMVKEAKKKEKELAKQLAKNHVQQARLDQKVHNSLTTWNKDILPCFDSVRNQKKTKELWWNGVPPSVRGKVWIMAVGNELNITHELFEIFKDRAKDTLKLFKEPDAEKVHKASREASMELIKLDVSRTYPHLCIFQKGGPYHNMLHGILGAYACYRPDVGYVQGMSFIAAVFLLNLEPPDAFICFSNLMNKPCQMAFFRLDQTIMQAYFATFEEYFQDNLPQLFDYFEELEVTPDLYIIDWMYTLYSKSLPLDVACRVWDVFFRDGEEFLFRTALGILQLYQNVLLGMDFIHIAQFLTKLPETIASGSLFKSIATIDIHQKKFGQVLAAHLTNQQQKDS